MKKNQVLRLRVSDEELSQLHTNAKQGGMSASALLRLFMNSGLSGYGARLEQLELRLGAIDQRLTTLSEMVQRLVSHTNH